jgi:hypothetical protein
MINLDSELEIGIERDGVWHTRFTMRQATVADAIAAVEKAPEGATNLTLRIYKAAEQIDQIGDITEIDAELLLGLPDIDIDPIYDAQDEIEKKLKGLRNPSSLTSSSTSSSGGTDSITQEP